MKHDRIKDDESDIRTISSILFQQTGHHIVNVIDVSINEVIFQRENCQRRRHDDNDVTTTTTTTHGYGICSRERFFHESVRCCMYGIERSRFD